jgi:hypothetical protein
MPKWCAIFPPVLVMICMIVGPILLSIGPGQASAYATRALTSIPLCRASPSPVGDYVGSPLSDWCNVSVPYNVSVSIPLSNVLFPHQEQMAYIIHNLWGYSFTVRICEMTASCKNPIVHTFSHNVNRNESSQTKDAPFTLDLFLGGNVTGSRTLLSCPSPTLITQSLGIEPACGAPKGYPAQLTGEFQYIKVEKVTYEEISSSLVWIVFENLIALPMTYAEVPQMYWASWTRSNSVNWMIAGGVVLGLGLLIAIVMSFVKILFRRF